MDKISELKDPIDILYDECGDGNEQAMEIVRTLLTDVNFDHVTDHKLFLVILHKLGVKGDRLHRFYRRCGEDASVFRRTMCSYISHKLTDEDLLDMYEKKFYTINPMIEKYIKE